VKKEKAAREFGVYSEEVVAQGHGGDHTKTRQNRQKCGRNVAETRQNARQNLT